MQRSTIAFLVASVTGVGCAATYAVPTQSLADAQSAERSAVELGAANQPKAKLHLELAHEQIALANASMKEGDNERADGLLRRAKSDAELAIALTRDDTAKIDAQKATVQADAQHTTNVNQGATQ